MEADLPAVLRRLAADGYPITQQRKAIAGLIMSQEKCFSADDLLAVARDRGLHIGRATIFRTLDLLARLGYVCKVHDGERAGYTVCGPGHHHHLVCSSCGQVVHLEGCPVSGYLRDVESSTGFAVAEHRLEIVGVCPQCRAANEAQG
ncbi:MAG: Fur family transcriptional regulator [Dehalococcoidales bacterium]|nr:Fur family transcriptional regulator [Dehalococcoidales bacterium]